MKSKNKKKKENKNNQNKTPNKLFNNLRITLILFYNNMFQMMKNLKLKNKNRLKFKKLHKIIILKRLMN